MLAFLEDRVAAPSAITKPSRSASNGLHAPAGSSLRVLNARAWANPAMTNSQIAASAPPATITSASPRSMISAASPMAFAEAAQAVIVQELGPKRLNSIDTKPAAMLEMI